MKNRKYYFLFASLPILLGIIFWLGTETDDDIAKPSSVHARLAMPPEPNPLDADPSNAVNPDTANEIAGEFNSGNEPPRSHTDLAVNDKLASLEKELKELQDSMNALMSKSESQPTAAADPALQQELAELSEQKEQLTNSYLDNAFASEPVDPSWDAEVNSKIAGGLAKIPALTSTVVACATTMCRINAVASDETKDAMAVMHSLDGKLDWEGQMRITVNHESGEMTAFLVRPGNTLPEIAN